jgi:uncharacterized protein
MTQAAEVVTGREQILDAQRRSAPWPYAELDVAGLLAEGWQPTPVHDIVLKVHQRCNLACTYCYVYEHEDQSWRGRPAMMSEEIWRAAVTRLGNHVRRHGLTSVRVVLHGGEPLLYGAERLAELADAVRAELPDTCVAEIGMQTNGVRLNAPTIAVLRQAGIRAGVSVDGVAADHDRYRVTRRGTGSFAAVSRALNLLRMDENRAAYAGILCTVAPDTDPIATYEQLLEFQPPLIDFLLPHANWQNRPAGLDGVKTPYADWLIAVFDRWYADPPTTRVRIFEDVISLVLGGRSRSEQVGLSPSAVLVVESDGAIEQVDALKSAYEGACATGLDVRHDEFDDALTDPGIIARQIGLRALAPECQRCTIRDYCGGGHYAHRYRAGSGFRNPSVYCADLLQFVQHVYLRILTDIDRLVATGAP